MKIVCKMDIQAIQSH